MARATNSYCVPMLIYGFTIITWTKKNFDVMTRKILNSHHQCSSVERLYLLHHKEGRGLISIENLFYRKLALTVHHLLSSSDSLLSLVQNWTNHFLLIFLLILELRVLFILINRCLHCFLSSHHFKASRLSETTKFDDWFFDCKTSSWQVLLLFGFQWCW